MTSLSRASVLCFVLAFLLPIPSFAAEMVDVNSASLEDLTKIIHIGESRAKELILLRPFSSLDDLARIKGISEARVLDIKEQGIAFINSFPAAIDEVNLEKESPKEWTKIQTPAKENTEEVPKTNYSLISLPLAIVSAGSMLLLKNNLK